MATTKQQITRQTPPSTPPHKFDVAVFSLSMVIMLAVNCHVQVSIVTAMFRCRYLIIKVMFKVEYCL